MTTIREYTQKMGKFSILDKEDGWAFAVLGKDRICGVATKRNGKLRML
jgi:hypothetical protein